MDEANSASLEGSPAHRYAWVRRLAFWWIAGMMGVCGLLFVAVDQFQIFPSPSATFVVGILLLPSGLGAAMIARARRRGTLEEPAAWPWWAAVGALMFTLWATIYLLVSRLPDVAGLHTLPSGLEARISLRPAYSLLYILLYPIFLLPYFVVRERAVLRRLVAADLVMLAFCSACFLAFPVGFERPPLPAVTDLGVWVLATVWSNDVSWNCMPSEHCMAAMIAALACWESDRRVGAFAFLATLAIGLSTLFTKQHYLVDVLAGYALAVGLHVVLRRSRLADPLPAKPAAAWDRLLNR